MLCTLAGYAIAFLVLRRLSPAKAHICAAAIVAVALAAYWHWFDRALHTDNRYYMRTVLLVGTLALGTLAAVQALAADGRLGLPVAFLPRLMKALTGGVTARAIIGAILVVMLVHAVETAKFVRAWTRYKAAVRALAIGAACGSGARRCALRVIGSDRRRSEPAILVFDDPFPVGARGAGFCSGAARGGPQATYFSLSCATATANQEADRVVPVASRRLVRVYACLHR